MPDAGNRLHTGDIGELDHRGYLSLVDRAKRIQFLPALPTTALGKTDKQALRAAAAGRPTLS